MVRRRSLPVNPVSVQTNAPDQGKPSIEEFQHVLNKMPPEDQKIIKSVSFASIQSYSGPLPAPESLEKYNKIIPDGADRIMRMAENQSIHRMKIENEVILGQVKQSGRGQTFGLIIAFGALVSSVVLALYGHDTVACIIGGGTVIALVSVFVIGKKEQKEKLAEKRSNFAPQGFPSEQIPEN